MNELYRYLTLAVTAEWRRRPDDERREHKRELAAAVAGNAARVHAYSLVGTRADADVLLWAVADDLEGLRALEVRLAATALWRHSTRPYAYLAARRRSRCVTSAAALPRSRKARAACAIWRCTILSPACRTAPSSASVSAR